MTVIQVHLKSDPTNDNSKQFFFKEVGGPAYTEPLVVVRAPTDIGPSLSTRQQTLARFELLVISHQFPEARAFHLHLHDYQATLIFSQDSEFSTQEIMRFAFDQFTDDEVQKLVAFRIESSIKKKDLVQLRLKELCKIVEQHNPQLAAYLQKGSYQSPHQVNIPTAQK